MSNLLMDTSTQLMRVWRLRRSPNDSDVGARVDAPARSYGSIPIIYLTVDLLLSLSTTIIFVVSAPASLLLNNTYPLFYLTPYSSLEPSCLAMLPRMLLTFLTIIFTLIFFWMMVCVCVYCYINTPIARLMGLQSPNFDVLCLQICLPTILVIL